jgi:hypothetical protein
MPHRPGAVQSLGEGGLGLLEEPATYRLYHCRRCGMQVCICAQCDCGNLYCPGPCAELARRESVRRAGARYQRTFRGACRHAARQRRYRERHSKVTHHPFSSATGACSVSGSSISTSESSDVQPQAPLYHPNRPAHSHCAFCGTVLPAFARVHPWRWSG